MYTRSPYSGFTLIELLVVISIISMLSSIALASLQTVRDRASYAKVALDFKQMKNAIELYSAENNDWPSLPITCTNGGARSSQTACWNDLDTVLNKYIPVVPTPLPNFLAKQPQAIYSYWVNFNPTFPNKIPVYDSTKTVNGGWLYCIVLRRAYLLAFAVPEQNSWTLNDHGVDPDSIDAIEGDYSLDTTYYPTTTHCPP